jgi:hypothetical protein
MGVAALIGKAERRQAATKYPVETNFWIIFAF